MASARQKWLASGSKIIGTVQIDNGAKNALLKRKSLLAVGVLNIIQAFDSNEAIEILDEDNNLIAVAKAKINAIELNAKLKRLFDTIELGEDIQNSVSKKYIFNIIN